MYDDKAKFKSYVEGIPFLGLAPPAVFVADCIRPFVLKWGIRGRVKVPRTPGYPCAQTKIAYFDERFLREEDRPRDGSTTPATRPRLRGAYGRL